MNVQGDGSARRAEPGFSKSDESSNFRIVKCTLPSATGLILCHEKYLNEYIYMVYIKKYIGFFSHAIKTDGRPQDRPKNNSRI